MRVLIACEFSGAVRRAFRALGHDAWSCDLLPAEDGSPYHIQGDVREVVRRGGWDLIIAHTPCTYLCNSGVRWLDIVDGVITNYERKSRMFDAAMLFNDVWLGGYPTVKKRPMICMENPIMHKYAKGLIVAGQQAQIIQPWMFGHPETKATCLWLHGLPPLKPTKVVRNEMFNLSKKVQNRVHYSTPGPDRWKERSRTLPGIAQAMAEQWGGLTS
jgi:hypothetical protein